ncbi:hypothetical protein OIO90_004506 [Microbotryomycetes sp. JL221]|nr:hypothetical protein OIO90_004506 [Microbotryomycetes sp. JL221]
MQGDDPQLKDSTTHLAFNDKTTESAQEVARELDQVQRHDQDDYDSMKPRKRLRDLKWPLEPDSRLWMDPLARDDVKPLRGFELESIATDVKIRSLLGSRSLRATLERLASLRDPNSKQASLRLLLGLRNVQAAPTTYRATPNDASTRYGTAFGNSTRVGDGGARGARGARGRGASQANRGRGNARGKYGDRAPQLLESTPDERDEVGKFVEAVQEALTNVRRAKGEIRL